MASPQGVPVWYELMTTEADAASRFYEAVVGWTIDPRQPGPVDYRMIHPAEGAVGGLMALDAAMVAAGARPMWVPYFGVSDTDATFEKAKALGAQVFVPPSDIPNVGRFAFMADPQGAPFYVMKMSGAEDSRAAEHGRMGACGWTELWTTDAAAALGFYGALLGIENTETLDLGPAGGYHFLDAGGVRIGALIAEKDQPPGWNAYFTVPDVAAAAEVVTAQGGRIDRGPMEVPGGEHIVLGHDPQGARFALVSPARG